MLATETDACYDEEEFDVDQAARVLLDVENVVAV